MYYVYYRSKRYRKPLSLVVSRQTNIDKNDFTNFLKEGAFVRRQGKWILLWDVISDNSRSNNWTLSINYTNGSGVKKNYKNQYIIENYQFQNLIFNLFSLDVDPFIHWNPIDENSFQKSFNDIKNSIDLGVITKAVPFTEQWGAFSDSIDQSKKIHFLKKLCLMPDNLYPYGEWNETSGFVGATPEIFADVKGSTLQTMALAGTADLKTSDTDFLADKKERAEHEIVVNSISNSLQTLGKVTIDPIQILKLPTLKHLLTRVEVELNQPFNLENFILQNHPTPALGPYPKYPYWDDFIKLPLQSDREIFGAPWTISIQDRIFSVVVIRMFKWSQERCVIRAGCGVIASSVYEKEFAEICKKIDSVKTIFLGL